MKSLVINLCITFYTILIHTDNIQNNLIDVKSFFEASIGIEPIRNGFAIHRITTLPTRRVDAEGLEPTTKGLKGPCSTN
tara:strand:+ start:98 stop:334 length:237 start_codon:yes stop_codon:yes gene_type:complete